ncbi:MAG: energy transducer TonB [Candidatus Aminicenantes bacterium]|nr:energy transducer TonB [Candidatus Aminicenantes bacterium]
MRTPTPWAPVILAALLTTLPLQAGARLDLKLRAYEGSREAALTPPSFVTSSYMQPTITANLHTESDLSKETAQIKRVFNLKDVTLLTEAVMTLGGETPDRPADTARHFFRLNGSAFQVNVRMIETKPSMRFLVVFNEIVKEKPQNILTTEMLLVGGHTAVLGFEDRGGKPYFCSFHVSGPADMIPAPPPPPPPPRPDDIQKKLEQFEKGAVKASKDIKPPRLVKKVAPVYPPEAKEKNLEGMVVINARIDTQGNVSDVMVLKSSGEIFNAAAIEAVKGWKYEPMVLEGKPRDAIFTVTIRFALSKDKKDPDPPKKPDAPQPPDPPQPPPPPLPSSRG